MLVADVVARLVGTRKDLGASQISFLFCKKPKLFCSVFTLACVCVSVFDLGRITPRDRSSSKKLAESSPIYTGIRSILVLGERLQGTHYGLVATRKEVHAQVIDAVQAVLAEEATQEGESVEKSSVRLLSSPLEFLSCLIQSELGFFSLPLSFS